MAQSQTITPNARAFLEELSFNMRANTNRIAASGDPDADKDHFALMSLHNRLTAIPRDGEDWQSYADNVIATTEAYQRHLAVGGHYGGPIVGSVMRDVFCLLDKHAPKIRSFTMLFQFLRNREKKQ